MDTFSILDKTLFFVINIPFGMNEYFQQVENALKALHLLSIGNILAVYDHILYHFFQKGLTHLIWKLKESFLSIIYLKLHDMVSQCVEP